MYVGVCVFRLPIIHVIQSLAGCSLLAYLLLYKLHLDVSISYFPLSWSTDFVSSAARKKVTSFVLSHGKSLQTNVFHDKVVQTVANKTAQMGNILSLPEHD